MTRPFHRPAFDAARFRAETPGTAEVVHLNAAGAGLPPRAVTKTVVDHLAREALLGPHWAAAEARDRLQAVRSSAATLLQCGARNIAFGGSAGRLWAMALLAVPLRPGARILVARSEWVGNVLNLIKLKQASGIEIEIVPVDEGSGLIDTDRLAGLIDERTAAVCLPVVGSGSGLRQPIERIAGLPRPDGCLLFIDAAQAAGRMPTGLGSTGADVLVAPSRKWLRGPRGQAVMALSDRALERLGDPPLLDQAGARWTGAARYAAREDAARFETYEFSVAGRLGLGAAIDHALGFGIEAIGAAIGDRLRRLHAGLSAMPAVRVFEAIESEPAFLTYVADGVAPEDLDGRLAEAGICAATVGLDYARLDFEARGLSAVNRVAPHAYTSEAEIDRFLDVVAEVLATT
jgi:selenocysteine lyase/cysteine desulfurase